MRIRMMFFVLCSILLAQGCAMDGVKHVTVVDEHATPLNGVLVLPLYTVSAGVGVGADGKGPHTAKRVLAQDPFLFDSGEDLMKQKIHTRGVMLPPVVAIGKSYYVGSWLFLKKQHVPRALQRSDVYGNEPIVLTTTTGTECKKTIEVLLQSAPDQETVKKLFGVEWMKEDVELRLDDKAKAMLEAEKQ
jgi:hypothetical protein